ncbi:hypothetical protein [Sphingomonas pokkalii]|uniref:Uncharacterized protein n=1 Tax=Sphingomonas pokkalii TaxID=2175090 RepID=A0A2U0SHH5_9SPHN|nr:hypothetical protein [Sphingomonas pokkalii]PVX30806.1 hypothetical protein DD559_16915 [Sphingomonas pokkalii]
MQRPGARVLAATFLALVPANAWAGSERTYEGTVGTAAVVMALEEDKDTASGRYFYRSVRLDIDLSGTVHGRTLDLQSRTTGDTLHLTRDGAALGGTLTTAKGRRLPVRLHPAGTPAPLPADLPAKLSTYERWHLAGLQLTSQRTETIGGRTIRWYREPLSGIRLFRVERGYAAPATAAVNRALARNHWAAVSAWFACTGYEGQPGTDTAKAQRPWLGDNHLSYLWNASWSCAGTAHPDFGTTGFSYDMRTGRELKLDELLRFGSGPIPPEESTGWYGYRSETFAPGVVALLKHYHPAEMTPPGPGDDDACNYADAEVWHYPSWALSEKGLWLGAYFARVQRACDAPDWAIIPWSALRLRRSEKP